jgi:SnoaL-like protein
MSNNLSRVWERYVGSWGVRDAAKKQAIFATCLASACIYADPLTTAHGWDELAQYMLDLERQIPGAHFVTDQFFAHHRRSVARWRMLNGAGTTLGEGISYAEYDDQDRLTCMTGFFDVPETTQPARPEPA